jgi:hypothetical protein
MGKRKNQSDQAPPVSKDQHKSRHMVRLTSEQHAALKALALRNTRKMTDELTRALNEHFKREGLDTTPAHVGSPPG